jgi:ribonuclease Z
MDFIFLGTSAAVPSVARDTTSLVFVGDSGAILVDCGGSPVQKLLRAGVDPLSIRHVVVTHLHADHAYGLPALIQNLSQLGRVAPLGILCRAEHVDALRTLLGVFGLLKRSDTFPLEFTAAGSTNGGPALVSGSLALATGANNHGRMPNMALRVDVVGNGTPSAVPRALVYSSDTAPCESVVELAKGADTLIHEATFPERDRGRFGVHSTPAEAGEVAHAAGVRRLILAHMDADYHGELEAMAHEARGRFGGIVEIAREFAPYRL